VTLAGGEVVAGDVLVLAAERVRSRVLQLFQDASAKPELVEEGALTFVVVGAGAAGVETAGALAELVHDVMPHVHPQPAVAGAQVILVDHGHAVLGPFSDDAHWYAARQLQRRGVQLKLGTSAKEIGAGHVTLSDGTLVRTHLTVWGGGLMAAPLAAASGLSQCRGGRIDVRPDLTVEGFPAVYALGDFANIPAGDQQVLPQLGSIAPAGQQAGTWADEFYLRSHHRSAALLDPAMIDTPAATGTTAERREGGPTSGQRGVRGRGWKPAAR
jgi:NADH:ubiquinone reductase (H+-translocating)